MQITYSISSLASTIVTAKRISVPRKMAADSAEHRSVARYSKTKVPQRQLVVAAPQNRLAKHVAAQTSLLLQRVDFAAHKHP
jgi:hypothetical protein